MRAAISLRSTTGIVSRTLLGGKSGLAGPALRSPLPAHFSLLRRKPPHSLNVRCAEVNARFSPGVSCRGSPRDLLRMTVSADRAGKSAITLTTNFQLTTLRLDLERLYS